MEIDFCEVNVLNDRRTRCACNKSLISYRMLNSVESFNQFPMSNNFSGRLSYLLKSTSAFEELLLYLLYFYIEVPPVSSLFKLLDIESCEVYIPIY